jgi:hypothetical protein
MKKACRLEYPSYILVKKSVIATLFILHLARLGLSNNEVLKSLYQCLFSTLTLNEYCSLFNDLRL